MLQNFYGPDPAYHDARHRFVYKLGPDAPRRDEIVYGLAMATGGRVHERSGGLKAADIKINDGQR